MVVSWVAGELAPAVTLQTSVSIRPEPIARRVGSFFCPGLGEAISLFAGFVAARVA